jgi:Domain of unknown function (DUF222)
MRTEFNQERFETLEEKVDSLFPERVAVFQEPPYSTVFESLHAIEVNRPAARSMDGVRDEVEWFVKLQRYAEAKLAQRLSELDERELESPSDETISNTDWMRSKFRMSSNMAYAQVRTARSLSELPATMDALEEGLISSQHASVISRCLDQTRETNLDPTETEALLLQAARAMDPRELKTYFNQTRYQSDPEAGVAAEEEVRRKQWLQVWKPWNNDWYKIEGELDPETGIMLKTALDAAKGRPARDDDREPAQRTAAALGDVVRCALDSGRLPELGGERPHLFVTADLETLKLTPGSKLAALDWGEYVTGETARRIGCDAAITPVVVSGGEILYVGRTSRAVPPKMREELNLRDRHCQADGCDVDARRCIPHHIIHWADGGPTELWNLILYCHRHHAKKHPEHHRFRSPRAP